MADERLARLLAEAVDDVDDAGRHARLGEQLDEPLGEERRVLGRLQHDRVAADERRAELPRRDRDREVPRRDRADDADRHPHAHHELVAELARRRLAEEAPALAGHVVGSCRSPPGRRRRPRRAPSPSRASSARSARPCASRRSSAKRKRIAPRSGAGTSRQSSNAAFAAATARSTSAAPERGNVAERLAGRGHDRLERLAALGRDPLAADEVLETRRGGHAADLRAPRDQGSATSVEANVPGARGRRRSRVSRRSALVAGGSPCRAGRARCAGR